MLEFRDVAGLTRSRIARPAKNNLNRRERRKRRIPIGNEAKRQGHLGAMFHLSSRRIRPQSLLLAAGRFAGCGDWNFSPNHYAGKELCRSIGAAVIRAPSFHLCWLLTIGFGHSEVYWYRVLERLGRNSLVGTSVPDAGRLPTHLAADEHHADWAGQKGYVATTVGGGCVLGVALTASADDIHLQDAYGVFAAEARDVEPEYAPETVSTDGWAATRNAFQALFPLITVVLCFLHGFLKIRDRCCKAHELHRRVWDVYHAATAEEFRRLMGAFQQWCATQTWTAPVREMLAKLWNKTESYVVAYARPGWHRTSNAVDRPMNRLCRLMYASRGLHGHQCSSELRLRGWALLLNFRPYAPRSNHPRTHDSPAHRLNGKRYHEHWLHNLMASTSLMGFKNRAPAIR